MLGAMSEKKKDKCHVVISYLFIMGFQCHLSNFIHHFILFWAIQLGFWPDFVDTQN